MANFVDASARLTGVGREFGRLPGVKAAATLASVRWPAIVGEFVSHPQPFQADAAVTRALLDGLIRY
jgi:hypothetical protein